MVASLIFFSWLVLLYEKNATMRMKQTNFTSARNEWDSAGKSYI